MGRPIRAALLALAPLLSACATTAADSPRFQRAADMTAAEADPWEGFNRGVYGFNNGFDRVIGKPVARTYRAVVPAAARRGVANYFNTQNEVLNFANGLLQGKVKSAFRALDRLLVNGILGLGLADHATAMGLDRQPHDFGQTLAVWGVRSGPYLVAPFFGPGTLRDQAGFAVDFIGDPADIASAQFLSREERYYRLGARIVNIRSNLMDSGAESLLRGSADEYATVRSAWLQRRRVELYDGAPPDDEEEVEPLPPAPAEAPAATTAAPAAEAPAAAPQP